MQYPLISCICITRKRVSLLKRAIICFEAQSYIFRELVIVYESDDSETALALTEYVSNPNITPIKVPVSSVIRLGYLRNIGVANARGTFICQWDDDDWHHPERLSQQYSFIQNTRYVACVLSRWLIFDDINKQVFISQVRLWEGSLLCKRDILGQTPYKNESRGEDTAIINSLSSRKLIYSINEMPQLYIYTYHGHNTFSYNHFNRFFKLGISFSPEDSLIISNLLQQESSDKKVLILNYLITHYLKNEQHTKDNSFNI